MLESPRFSVIGLGKLGCSMAAAIAARGLSVVGVDTVPEIVRSVNAGLSPIRETGMDHLMALCRQRFRATTDCQEAISNSDVSFIVVPTPSRSDGSFSLDHVSTVFAEVGRALSTKDEYHLVVLTSTVSPGSVREALMPILERECGSPAGESWGLCYSPEFIALGSVIRDFLNPDFVLIGESDPRAGDVLEASYRMILETCPPCVRMSFENAELTKLAVNAFVTTKISFANMLATICDKMSGCDVDVVTKAIGMDSRIGSKYLRGALGYGGPCFPRDNSALRSAALSVGVDAILPAIVDQTNREVPNAIVSRVIAEVAPGSTIAILGLAYKSGTHVIEQSQAIKVAAILVDKGYRVQAYDPLIDCSDIGSIGVSMDVYNDLKACVASADAAILATPDPAFEQLAPEDIPDRTPPYLIFDCWRALRSKMEALDSIWYRPWGIGRY